MESSLLQEIPQIPGYHQLRLIRSQGGMSHIYRGTRIENGQEVIIKLMPAPKDEQEALKFQRRFNQEILIARLSANNHILAAADHGDIPLDDSDESRFYLVYPYIEHGSLADLLTYDRPWETWELAHIADVVAQAAEGLFHLHKSGIVHQDVKPNNLLWMPADVLRNPLRRIHLWLIDFGAAEPERNGKSREIKGTLKYLAPEQINGEIKYSIDQYALALVARLLLTGHEPSEPDKQTSLLSTPPTQLNPRRLFEPEIDNVLFRALKPYPEDRFSSVVEFAQALQQAVLKQIQRNPRASRPISSLVLPQQPPANLPIPPVSSRQEERTMPLTMPAPPQEPVVLPPLNSPKPYSPPQRDPTRPKIVSRPNPAMPVLPALPTQQWLTVPLPDTLRVLAWSPNATELVCTFYHDFPQIISVKRSVEPLPGFAYALSACWSPDGRFLALSMDDEHSPQAKIRFCDRSTLKERRALSFDQPEPVRGLDWSSRGLFAVWLRHKLVVYDLSNISSRKRLPDPAYTFSLPDDMFCDQLTTLRWSPSGEWLAAGSNNGQIVCWQPHTNQYFEHQPLKKNIRSLGWSPDGRMLVVAFANKQVLFWNLQTDQIVQAAVPESPRVVSVSSQTGHIAVATERALFFFEHLRTLAPTAIHPGQLYATFSPDNKLATLEPPDGKELGIWHI